MATQTETTNGTGTALAVPPSPQREQYAIMKDRARIFSMSPLIPEHLRAGGADQAAANCLIALQMAEAMGESPLVVMQNIHIVKGKAGFAAQYMIARANASGIFTGRINWRIEGRGTDNLSVTAYATLADTGEEIEFTVDMAMAKAEGWTSNTKYKSMPEVMLRYRSATFLVRFYAPDVMLGYQTSEEAEDVAFAETSRPALTGAALLEQALPDPPATVAGDPSAEGETRDDTTALSSQEGRDLLDMGEAPTLDQAKDAVARSATVDEVNGLVSSYAGQLSEADQTVLSGVAMNRIAELEPA